MIKSLLNNTSRASAVESPSPGPPAQLKPGTVALTRASSVDFVKLALEFIIDEERSN